MSSEYTPNEERVLRTLRHQGHMRANTSAANLMGLESLRDKGAVEWVEKERKWKLVPQKVSPVVAILEDIQALSDEEIDFLFQMLDSGMWDEWDISLVGGLGMFGAAEIRLAARSGALAAKWIEKQPKP